MLYSAVIVRTLGKNKKIKPQGGQTQTWTRESKSHFNRFIRYVIYTGDI